MAKDRLITGGASNRVDAAVDVNHIRVAVSICAYTEKRWDMLVDAIASVQEQSYPVEQIIVCIDHNEGLAERCHRHVDKWANGTKVPIIVVENQYDGRLGSARNTALRYAECDVVAFLDDDARADSDWLRFLVAPYHDSDVVAVGGAPIPVLETSRPRWFPPQLDWVFGCYYEGLPKELGLAQRLIGASMSVRKEALSAIGGFHSDNHDDMDMCHRLAHRWPDQRILLEPLAVVHHNVSAERVTWGYFWRRCFFVNKGKVKAFRDMGSAASLDADRRFVLGALRRSAISGFEDVLRCDGYGIVRFGVVVAGAALAAAGHIAGRLIG
jgi:cellulose synthase/poly-beta-1,6-N-acetylglucosamine synthase-like glycosyltransferase